MTALYFHALRPGDIVATKAHASPVLYAIEYLRGRLSAEQLRGLRSLGGAPGLSRAGGRIPRSSISRPAPWAWGR